MDETSGAGMGMPPDDYDEVPGGPIEKAEGAARKVVLAGIGAVASACDTAEETFNRFADRGAQVQAGFQERVDEAREQNQGARTRFSDYVRNGMDVFLNTLNVPSKGDIDTINVKLNILSRKLDDIQMENLRQESAAADVTPKTPPGPDLDLTT